MSAESMRVEYSRGRLVEGEVAPDPIAQFRAWFEAATAAAVPEPNAMTLATATADGRPSARVVLLKAFDERGFCFFTNYESRKARELEANPRASLAFFWPTLERQVRVEGRAERVTDSESDQYFLLRPVGARLGAWASRQSEVVADRAALEAALEAGAEDFRRDDDVYVVTTDPSAFHTVKSALEARGLVPTESELAMVPKSTVPVSGEHVAQLLKLIEALEDLDDVQKVWGNFEIDDAELAKLES